MPPLPAYVHALPQGVYAIDTGFHRDAFDAAYLIVHEGRAAFFDTGANPGVPRLLAALDALNIDRAAVDWVIPSHVHLDHAGGAGLLMRELPAARMLVHPRGARHMIDPSVLYQGALAIYGQAEMDRSYGVPLPVDPARVDSSHDGQTVHLAGRPLLLIDAPGHARHHHVLWDAATRGWFTGDCFGLSYPEFDTARGPWIMPTSTPVQFEPEVLKATIARMLSYRPEGMYLTHFGRVGDVDRLGASLIAQIDEMVALALALRDAPDRHQALRAGLLEISVRRAAEHGCALGRAEIERVLELDLTLNAQGIAIWLDRDRPKEPQP
jgi:glyoxylase-like metal-dependent hydrolase (beta-lactamase superfamily II)